MKHIELVDRIYDAVKKMIADHELRPGEKIVQEKLAAQLGVSRSPLLKALQRLESELLVESIPRRGVIVKTLSHKEVVDIFQCRAVLEGLSARLAATMMSDDALEELQEVFAKFINVKGIDSIKYAQADRKFHNLILSSSGNAVIARLEMLVHVQLNAYQAGLLRSPEETLPEHLDIISALVSRDGLKAEKAMRLHVERSLEVFLKSSPT